MSMLSAIEIYSMKIHECPFSPNPSAGGSGEKTITNGKIGIGVSS